MTRNTSSLAVHAMFGARGLHDLAGFDEADLRLLRMFSVVVAAGGLSAATAELQVDLSTVSRQFKELEGKLGVRLAQRGRGGFTLTKEGGQLHLAARQLFDAIQAFKRDTAALSRPAGPCLRVGLVDALLTAHRGGGGVAAALGGCCAALPDLDVQLTTLRPIEIERGILAGELDVGVLAAHSPAAGLEQHRLYGEGNSLFVAPGHAWYDRAPADPGAQALRQGGIVVDPYWDDVPHPELFGMLRGRTRADSIEGVALLVASGRFAGFLPDHLVASTPQLRGLRQIHPQRYSYVQDIVLTCKQGNAQAAVRELLRQARQQLA